MRKIITSITLFCFLLSNISFALSPPLKFDGLADGHHKRMSLAIMKLQLYLQELHKRHVRFSDAPLDDLIEPLRKQLRYIAGEIEGDKSSGGSRVLTNEDTVFNPYEIELFFNEIEELGQGVFSISATVRKGEAIIHTYKLVFSTAKDNDGGFPITPFTLQEYDDNREALKARAEPGLPIERPEKDQVAMARYSSLNEKIIDRFTRERMEESNFAEVKQRRKTLNWFRKYPDAKEPGRYWSWRLLVDLELELAPFLKGFNTSVIDAFDGENIVFVRVPKEVGLPVIEEDGKKVTVRSHTSGNSVYFYIMEDKFDAINTQMQVPSKDAYEKGKALLFGKILTWVVHEVGASYKLPFVVSDDGRIINDLDRAYYVINEFREPISFTEFPALATFRDRNAEDATPADLDDVRGRDYAAGEDARVAGKAESIPVDDSSAMIVIALAARLSEIPERLRQREGGPDLCEGEFTSGELFIAWEAVGKQYPQLGLVDYKSRTQAVTQWIRKTSSIVTTRRKRKHATGRSRIRPEVKNYISKLREKTSAELVEMLHGKKVFTGLVEMLRRGKKDEEKTEIRLTPVSIKVVICLAYLLAKEEGEELNLLTEEGFGVGQFRRAWKIVRLKYPDLNLAELSTHHKVRSKLERDKSLMRRLSPRKEAVIFCVKEQDVASFKDLARESVDHLAELLRAEQGDEPPSRVDLTQAKTVFDWCRLRLLQIAPGVKEYLEMPKGKAELRQDFKLGIVPGLEPAGSFHQCLVLALSFESKKIDRNDVIAIRKLAQDDSPREVRLIALTILAYRGLATKGELNRIDNILAPFRSLGVADAAADADDMPVADGLTAKQKGSARLKNLAREVRQKARPAEIKKAKECPYVTNCPKAIKEAIKLWKIVAGKSRLKEKDPDVVVLEKGDSFFDWCRFELSNYANLEGVDPYYITDVLSLNDFHPRHEIAQTRRTITLIEAVTAGKKYSAVSKALLRSLLVLNYKREEQPQELKALAMPQSETTDAIEGSFIALVALALYDRFDSPEEREVFDEKLGEAAGKIIKEHERLEKLSFLTIIAKELVKLGGEKGTKKVGQTIPGKRPEDAKVIIAVTGLRKKGPFTVSEYMEAYERHCAKLGFEPNISRSQATRDLNALEGSFLTVKKLGPGRTNLYSVKQDKTITEKIIGLRALYAIAHERNKHEEMVKDIARRFTIKELRDLIKFMGDYTTPHGCVAWRKASDAEKQNPLIWRLEHALTPHISRVNFERDLPGHVQPGGINSLEEAIMLRRSWRYNPNVHVSRRSRDIYPIEVEINIPKHPSVTFTARGVEELVAKINENTMLQNMGFSAQIGSARKIVLSRTFANGTTETREAEPAYFYNLSNIIAFLFRPDRSAQEARSRDARSQYAEEPGKCPEDAKKVIAISPMLQRLLAEQGYFTVSDYIQAWAYLARDCEGLGFRTPGISDSTVREDLYRRDDSLLAQGIIIERVEGPRQSGEKRRYQLTERVGQEAISAIQEDPTTRELILHSSVRLLLFIGYDKPERIYNALERYGIKTIGDLLKLSEQELLRKVRQIGKGGIAAIKRDLAAYGWELAAPERKRQAAAQRTEPQEEGYLTLESSIRRLPIDRIDHKRPEGVYNALERGDVYTIADLLERSPRGLKWFLRQIGDTAILAIMKAVDRVAPNIESVGAAQEVFKAGIMWVRDNWVGRAEQNPFYGLPYYELGYLALRMAATADTERENFLVAWSRDKWRAGKDLGRRVDLARARGIIATCVASPNMASKGSQGTDKATSSTLLHSIREDLVTARDLAVPGEPLFGPDLTMNEERASVIDACREILELSDEELSDSFMTHSGTWGTLLESARVLRRLSSTPATSSRIFELAERAMTSAQAMVEGVAEVPAAAQLDAAWNAIPENYHRGPMNYGTVRGRLNALISEPGKQLTDGSAVIFSEKVTFGHIRDGVIEPGLGILLPKLVESGVRVAVVTRTDEEAAFIRELNSRIDKLKSRGKEIVFGKTIPEIQAQMSGTRSYRYFRLQEDDAVLGEDLVEVVSDLMVRQIIEALGKAAALVEREIERLQRAARLFAESA